ncbi:hypothetical protein DL98DRAFT_594825 [Cadophora sp. DSE1049]|nr:hypothetical protein DL98DRAFT_594825 [Cadophora sp. DSE1049]
MNEQAGAAAQCIDGNAVNYPTSDYGGGLMTGHLGFTNGQIGAAAQNFNSKAVGYPSSGYESGLITSYYGYMNKQFALLFMLAGMDNLTTGSNTGVVTAAFTEPDVMGSFGMGLNSGMPNIAPNSVNNFTPGSYFGHAQPVMAIGSPNSFTPDINPV